MEEKFKNLSEEYLKRGRAHVAIKAQYERSISKKNNLIAYLHRTARDRDKKISTLEDGIHSREDDQRIICIQFSAIQKTYNKSCIRVKKLLKEIEKKDIQIGQLLQDKKDKLLIVRALHSENNKKISSIRNQAVEILECKELIGSLKKSIVSLKRKIPVRRYMPTKTVVLDYNPVLCPDIDTLEDIESLSCLEDTILGLDQFIFDKDL